MFVINTWRSDHKAPNTYEYTLVIISYSWGSV